ncbi:hybrid sensor histidine kinase/response regulator [Halarcobacter ebronensis]|uniref:histidine kinase n=1 Tax=Halarcobacter ebronensis TaxID=1462615 RepID=A0A4Q1ARV1_9BACT|nr:hybrid sensor histidine kinase/response regulator [Halarcobacter ebronensis]QKF80558.1 two-component system sensor histidine kinase/response regulator fusion protein [Halarcobacter ebronensis]RXK08364.1 hybrid sensor histidine kinase/response regulator [Halarcobacter ebronensis]
MDKKYTILIVDDKLENLQYLHIVLKDEDYDIRATPDAMMALEAAKLNTPDLILLDIKMPNIDGYELCRMIKKQESLKEIPIIFISALDSVEDKVKAFEEGGVDYITKPFEPKEIQARIKTQLQIHKSKIMIARLYEQQDLFVKKIMHEMNTPVSIISLNTDLMERQNGPSKEVEAIKASVKTLSSIYGDLSYKIKKETKEYKISQINLLEFISSRVQFFDELANTKDIHLNLEYNKNCDVFINKYELERVIDNTISNAIKYSKQSSEINIFFGEEAGDTIIEIEDFGVGIEDLDMIFQAYYQQSNKRLGLGLGLNIVKEICDKYGIDIDVMSKKGVGTKFVFDIKSIVKSSL